MSSAEQTNHICSKNYMKSPTQKDQPLHFPLKAFGKKLSRVRVADANVMVQQPYIWGTDFKIF